MPIFNTRIAVTFAGDSAKLVAAEFEKFSRDVGGHLDGIRKGIQSTSRDLKTLKNFLGTAAVGKVMFEGAIAGLKALDSQFKILGPTSREVLGDLSESIQGLTRLDVEQFASNLGRGVGRVIAHLHGLNDGVAEATAEFHQNLKNAEKSLPFQRQSTADLRKQIFGDPAELKRQVDQLVKAIDVQKRLGESGVGSDQHKAKVKELLDSYNKIGVVAPAALLESARGYNVLSTAQEKAIQNAKRAGEEEERAGKKRADALRDARRDYESLRSGLDPTYARQLQFNKAVESLIDALNRGDLKRGLEEYDDLVARLRSNLQIAGELKPGDYAATAGPMIDLSNVASNTREEQAKRLEQWQVEHDRIVAVQAQVEAFRTRLVDAGKSQAEINDLTADYAQQLGLLPAKVDKVADSWGKITLENFARGAQSAVASFAMGLLDGSQDAASAFGDNVARLVKTTVAEAFAKIALDFGRELIAAAAKAAAISNGGDGKSSTGGFAAMFQTGGNYSWMASLWPVLAIAAVGVAAKYFIDKSDKKVYGTNALVTFNDGGLYGGTLGRRSEQTARGISTAIINVLRGLQEASGTFMTGMQHIAVKIRNDKKGFQAYVGDVMVGVFGSANEAIIAAAKTAFLQADFAGELDPYIKNMVEGFRGNDPEKLVEAVQFVRRVLDEASGLSDVELRIRNLPSAIAALKTQLLELGMYAAEAGSLSMKWGIAQLGSLWRDLSGERLSPKEELEQKRQQGALLLAQKNIWMAELLARKAYLEGQLKLGGVLHGGGGGGGGGAGGGILHRQLSAQVAYVKGLAQVSNAELGVRGQYLGGRREYAEAEAAILQAELDAINEALKALAMIDIDLSKIKLGGGGRRRRSRRDDGTAANDNTLWDLLLGEKSTLNPKHQLDIALRHFRELKGQDAKRGFASQLLDEAQGFFGGATGPYDTIYREVIKAIGGEKWLSGKRTESDARMSATEQLFKLADAAASVTSIFTAPRRSRSTQAARASGGGLSLPSLSGGFSGIGAALEPANSPLAAGGGFAGSTFSGVTAIDQRVQTTRIVAALEDVQHTIRRTARRRTSGGGGGSDFVAAPPPPPPPSGTNTSSPTLIGRSGGVDRVDRVA